MKGFGARSSVLADSGFWSSWARIFCGVEYDVLVYKWYDPFARLLVEKSEVELVRGFRNVIDDRDE